MAWDQRAKSTHYRVHNRQTPHLHRGHPFCILPNDIPSTSESSCRMNQTFPCPIGAEPDLDVHATTTKSTDAITLHHQNQERKTFPT